MLRALSNLQVKYSLKFGILEPFWELWEGLPWEGLCEGLTHGSAEPGHKNQGEVERGKKPKPFPTCSSPKSQGLQGDLQPEPPNPTALWTPSHYSQGLEC